MDGFVYRPLDVDQDLPSALKLRNEYMEERPSTMELMRAHILGAPSTLRAIRSIQSRAGLDTGYLVCIELFRERVTYSHLYTRDDDAYADMLGEVNRICASTSSSRCQVWVADKFPGQVASCVVAGYRMIQRTPESVCRLNEVPNSMWDSDTQARAMGYEIIDLGELEARLPTDWAHRVWRLEMDLMKDVPLPYPFEETPFDDFMRLFEALVRDREGLFYALADDELVGHSGLHWNQVNRLVAETAITGVVPGHRRKGLARALKVASFKWARSKGVQRIYTDNEEGNPMWLLNQALGFRRAFDWLCMEKPSPNAQ